MTTALAFDGSAVKPGAVVFVRLGQAKAEFAVVDALHPRGMCTLRPLDVKTNAWAPARRVPVADIDNTVDAAKIKRLQDLGMLPRSLK
jgi:hypothetical protein